MKYVCTIEEFLKNYYSEVCPRGVTELDFADEFALEYIRWDELRKYCEKYCTGNPDLCALLADMYMNGKGAETDEETALKLLRAGARKGSPRCMNSLANKMIDRALIDFKFEDVFPLLEKAVSLDFLPAYNTLAWLYAKGCGTAQNREKALALYKKAADGGLLSAKYNYGMTLIREDTPTALAYIKEAALGGYEKAACWLGQYYLNGIYRAPDYEKAHMWLSKAALGGSDAALRFLGEMYEKGFFVEKDYARAEFFYTQAFMLGYEGARRELARMRREMNSVGE